LNEWADRTKATRKKSPGFERYSSWPLAQSGNEEKEEELGGMPGKTRTKEKGTRVFSIAAKTNSSELDEEAACKKVTGREQKANIFWRKQITNRNETLLIAAVRVILCNLMSH